MRKQFFLLTLLLCLCGNIAWGIEWVGEVKSNSNFYIYNKGANLWIGIKNDAPYTFANSNEKVLFTISNNSIYKDDTNHYLRKDGGDASIGIQKELGWFGKSYTIEYTWETSTTNGSTSYSLDDRTLVVTNETRYMDARGNDVILQFPKKGDKTNNYNQWLLISQLQFNNHIAYQTFLNRLEVINADETDYSSCASYLSFSSAKSFSKTDNELVSATTSDITTALSTLNSTYSTVQSEYAELQKASYLSALAGKITTANGLVTSPMNNSVLSDLNDKINTAGEMTSSNTGEEIVTASNNLDDAIDNANASIEIYSIFNTLVGAIATQVSTLDAAGQAAYNNTTAITPYNNRTMTDGIAETAALYAALRVAAKAQTTDNADMTLAIANPSFELANLAGWSDGAGILHAVVNKDYAEGAVAAITSGADGTYVYACRNGSQADMYVSQTLDNLQPGIYQLKFKIAGNTDGGNNYKIKATFGTSTSTFSISSTTEMQEITLDNLLVNSPSDITIKVGYNDPSKTMSNPWFKIDNFTLTRVARLNLTISGSNIAEGTFFVDEEIASGFSFAYSDGEVAVPTPTLGSSSSDFYYTITTNSISSIKTDCDGGHTSDVITYDPSTNQLKAWNAGTATITFHHNSTSIANEAEQSFNVVVSKIANPITITLDGATRNSKNIGFNTNVTLAYSSPSDVDYSVIHRDGSSDAVTLAGTTLSSSTAEGTDYWDISQAENYKYEAGSAFVRIQVNEVPETESYLLESLTGGENHHISESNYEINLSYSPLSITYTHWNSGAAISQASVCTWYDANGAQLGSQKESMSSTAKNVNIELPENTRRIVISHSGLGSKYISNVQVVRRTYINASLEDEDLGNVYVGNNESTTLNVDWGTSNGGNLSVESNNSHFAVSAASIETSANSNGSTTLTVTYTPDNTSIGEEEATISIRDTYHYTYVTIRATAIKQKALVYGYGLLYSSSKNIQIDDAGTEVYDATFNAMNNEVTLNKLTASNDKAIIIPANNVVLLYKADDKEEVSSTIDFEYTTTETNVSIAANNCFVHHDDSNTGYANYLLGEQGGVVAFHLFTGAESALANYNVLQLPISPSPAPSAISIVTEGNTATALVPVYEDNSAVAGQKANGKKILIEGRLYIQQGDNLYDALGRKVQ